MKLEDHTTVQLIAIGRLAGWLTAALMVGGCSKPAAKDPRLQSSRVEVFEAQVAGSNSRTFTGIVETRVQSDLAWEEAQRRASELLGNEGISLLDKAARRVGMSQAGR